MANIVTSEDIEVLLKKYADANTDGMPGFPEPEIVEETVRRAVEGINLGAAGSDFRHQEAREIVARFFDVESRLLRERKLHLLIVPLVGVCSMVSTYALQAATMDLQMTMVDAVERIPFLREQRHCGICPTCTGLCAG